MKTYLVTGGCGFIGTNFIRWMFKNYGNTIQILNLDKLTYAGNPENLKAIENNPDYTFIKGDICDKNLVNGLFQSYDIDYVVHFAAESHVDRSILSA
ncbi:MAG TPA: GDP-mannose 4,6-dehydratase, partial [Methanocorpusculum sp.]|nr:GDP-mannose 4,6-dehydratase [Methanocorpusculum sp.]